MKGGDSVDVGALAHCLFIALLRDGNNISNAEDDAG